MSLTRNREFWDRKAKENPYWYVSSYGSYLERDLEDFWASGQEIWANIKKALSYQPNRSDVVFEIGCGVGRLTRAIAPEVKHLHAQDISKEMLVIAQHSTRCANVTFHHGDGESLRPLEDNCADLVLAYNVFQHLPSCEILRKYLAEMVRVAKPGALLAFTLSPCGWHTVLLPLLRARRWLLEFSQSDGPRELFAREWVGIRPSIRGVSRLSPIALNTRDFDGDKWFFWGKVHV